jgi:tetratricopeptide (TPR) repeat protein
MIVESILTGIAANTLFSAGTAGTQKGLAKLKLILRDQSQLDPNHDIEQCIEDAIRQSVRFFHAHLTAFYRPDWKTRLREAWADGSFSTHGLVGLLRNEHHKAAPWLDALRKALDAEDSLKSFGSEHLASNQAIAALIQPDSPAATFNAQRDATHQAFLEWVSGVCPQHWETVRADVTRWIERGWDIGGGKRITFYEVLIASVRQLFHDGSHEVAREKLHTFLLTDLHLREVEGIRSENTEAFDEQVQSALLDRTGALKKQIELLATQNQETHSKLDDVLAVTTLVPDLLTGVRDDVSEIKGDVKETNRLLAALHLPKNPRVLAAAGVALCLIITGIIWVVVNQFGQKEQLTEQTDQISQQTDQLSQQDAKLDRIAEIMRDPEVLAGKLRTFIKQKSEEQIAAAKGDWKKIGQIEDARDRQLRDVEETVTFIVEGLKDDASPVFARAAEILAGEGGPEGALQYLKGRRQAILEEVDRHSSDEAASRTKKWNALRPILLEAELHEKAFEWDEALADLRLVVEKAPLWYRARLRLGQRLRNDGNFTESERQLREAVRLAEGDKDKVVSASELGVTLMKTGYLDEAEAILRKAAQDAKRSLGPDHLDTHLISMSLGSVLLEKGLYDEAESIFSDALVALKRIGVPDEHHFVLICTSRLASLLHEKGEYDEAEQLFRRDLKISERTLGPDHPDTLACVNNLANLLVDVRNYDEAEQLYNRALETCTRVLGSNHPNTVACASNLGVFLSTKGDLDQAEPIYRHVLKLREQALGRDHSATLLSVANLGSLLQDKGEYDQAESLLQRALEGRERTLGPDHPDTIDSVTLLGNLAIAKKDYVSAEELFRRAMQTRVRIFGRDHPFTLNNEINLGTLYVDQEEYDAAATIFRRVVKVQERDLGPDDPRTLDSWLHLANVLYDKRDHDAAEPIYLRVLQTRERLLGREHPSTLESVSSVGNLRLSKGDYDDAERLHRRVLAVRERDPGPDDPDTIRAVRNLAHVYFEKADYAAAEPLYRRVSKALENDLGPEDPDTLKALTYLANTLFGKKDYAAAESLYQRVMRTREGLLGREHAATLSSADRLVELYLAKGDYDAAEPLYRRFLPIHERIDGMESPSTLGYLNGLGFVLFKKAKYDEAETYWRRALEARERVNGPDHFETLVSVNNMGRLAEERGDVSKAIPLIRRAYQGLLAVRGAEDAVTIQTKASLDRCIAKQEKAANK